MDKEKQVLINRKFVDEYILSRKKTDIFNEEFLTPGASIVEGDIVVDSLEETLNGHSA